LAKVPLSTVFGEEPMRKKSTRHPGPTLKNELPSGVADDMVVVLCARDDGRVVVKVERRQIDSEHATGWKLMRIPPGAH
jgi:hypothetical protein